MRLGAAVFLPDQNCFGTITAIQRFGRAFMRFGVKLETGELCMVEQAAVLPAILPKPLAARSGNGPTENGADIGNAGPDNAA